MPVAYCTIKEAEAKAAKCQSPIVQQKEAEAMAVKCQLPVVQIREAEAMAANNNNDVRAV